MKKIVIVTISALAASAALAEEIQNVAICAAECKSESLGILGHDLAEIGVIYYAPVATDAANLSNTGLCLSNAKSVKVYSDRLENDYSGLCMQALQGKFFNQTVTITTSEVGQIFGGFTGEPIPVIGATEIEACK